MIILAGISTKLLGIAIGSVVVILVIVAMVLTYLYKKKEVRGDIKRIEPSYGNDPFTTIILWEAGKEKPYLVYKSMLENISVGYYVELSKRNFESIYTISFAKREV